MVFDVGMDRHFWGSDLEQSLKSLKLSQFVANSSRWLHKIPKIQMI